MLKRLDGIGLVDHQPYHGVSLTPDGQRLALEVVRHHRLLESYLSEALGMPWDRVHDEAEVLEHYISEELEGLIADKLGDPSHDPHGDPIPGPDLALPEEEGGRPLDSMVDGEAATFTRVSDSDPRMLRYLAERGIKPGARVLLIGRQPFDGPVTVEVEGAEHTLGGELVRRMLVSGGAEA
jgi:DtxR family Mn-dependent transcriptional regulator